MVKNSIRRREAVSERRRRRRNITGYDVLLVAFHLTMAAIYGILRPTDAFRMQTVTKTGIASTSRTNADPARIRRSTYSSSSPPPLYVLSNPRRRTTSGNNVTPIIEVNTNPMINVEENNGDDYRTSPLSLPLTVQVSSASTSAMLNQSSPSAEKTFEEMAAGAACRCSLFRRQHSSAVERDPSKAYNNNFYPTPSPNTAAGATTTTQPRPDNTVRPQQRKQKQVANPQTTATVTEVTTLEELDRYWPRCLEEGEEVEDEECLVQGNSDDGRPLNYNQLLKGISVKGDTQIIGSKDHPGFVHPVIRLMHERKRQQDEERKDEDGTPKQHQQQQHQTPNKKDKIALVVEGGGMRGCVSAGMVCAIHCLGLSDTIDVVYGSSAGAVIAAYFVSKQLPYFGPEVYYDSLTTMEKPTSSSSTRSKKTKPRPSNKAQEKPMHVVDDYDNNYFIDTKRLTRSMGLGLCDPRLLKDVWTRRIHGKPMMNLHYMFENIMRKKKPIDYKTFVERQKVQPLKVVATGLSSEKPYILSHENGHFDTVEDLCNSLHASCLLPGIAGPVMNVLKRASGGKPNFVLRNTKGRSKKDKEEYEPLADAMLSSPIPYDIAHDEGATHVLVIRSSPDGTNLLAAPSIMAWIGSMIFKRYFLRKNNLPGMYKRSQTEQRHQRLYAKTILELNDRTNNPPPVSKPNDDADTKNRHDQTMTIALEPGSDEVSHLETTREGIFQGVRQGFARAYDALVEDPAMRGRGKEMALRYFPDEILEYDPNGTTSSSPEQDARFRPAFEKYLESTGILPKDWTEVNGRPVPSQH